MCGGDGRDGGVFFFFYREVALNDMD